MTIQASDFDLLLDDAARDETPGDAAGGASNPDGTADEGEARGETATLAAEAEMHGLLTAALDHPAYRRDFVAEAVTRLALETAPAPATLWEPETEDLLAVSRAVDGAFQEERALFAGTPSQVLRARFTRRDSVLLRASRLFMYIVLVAALTCFGLGGLLAAQAGGAGVGLTLEIFLALLLGTMGVALGFAAPRLAGLLWSALRPAPNGWLGNRTRIEVALRFASSGLIALAGALVMAPW